MKEKKPSVKGNIVQQQGRTEIENGSFLRKRWAWVTVLGLALGLRFLWLIANGDRIGRDAVRYLWISEHLSRGEWELFPQVFTSPLLPGVIGVMSWLTGENLWTGRIICILGNTLAVGLVVVLFGRLAPNRPALAWLTGVGVALDLVWCRLSCAILTDNFFYPALMGLWILLLKLRERLSWRNSLAFGMIWGLAYLSREIGLYYGAILLGALAVAAFWESGRGRQRFLGMGRLVFPALVGLLLIAGGWVIWLSENLGTFSLGEGPKIYSAYSLAFDRGVFPNSYSNGTFGVLKLKPYEMQEYTRFPRPGEERFPKQSFLDSWRNPGKMLKRVINNLCFTVKNTFNVTPLGFAALMILLAMNIPKGLSLQSPATWLAGAGGLLLVLHLQTLVNEARYFGWCFPWVYFGLAWAILTGWEWIRLRSWPRGRAMLAGGLLLLLTCAPVLHRNLRGLPNLWVQSRQTLISVWASQEILQNYGPGAVISSIGKEEAYLSQGRWIGLPRGSFEDIMEWLYLGNADFLLLSSDSPRAEFSNALGADPAALQLQYPEMRLMGEYDTEYEGAKIKARLFRFQPQPEKLAALQQQYSWAGRRP